MNNSHITKDKAYQNIVHKQKIISLLTQGYRIYTATLMWHNSWTLLFVNSQYEAQPFQRKPKH